MDPFTLEDVNIVTTNSLFVKTKNVPGDQQCITRSQAPSYARRLQSETLPSDSLADKGKVDHFFGLPLCQCCRFVLWGFYPIGAGLEHCPCIGSSGRGYQLANAVPIKATGTPIPCHWRIKFQVTNENQSKRLDFQSLPSEGRWSANPAVFQKLCGPISLATRIQLECK